MQLHRRIRTLRIRKGLTGMELARRAGVSPSYVSLIEHGEKIPSETVAVRIAQALEEREDLYRVWAVTSRMDERTRDAVLRVSQSGELDVKSKEETTIGPPAGEAKSAKPPAIGNGFHDDLLAHGLAMPLLVPGAVPRDGEILADEVETRVCVDARLLGVEPSSRLVALRVDELNGARVRSWLREDDIVLLEHNPRTLAAGRIHAIRVEREGLLLSKVTMGDGRLLLLSDPSDDDPPRALPIPSGSSLKDAVFGTVVASFRSWR